MMTDSQFARTFSMMIFCLVVLTVVLITLGIVIGGSIDDKLKAQSEAYTQSVIAERTMPVGQLNVGELEPAQEVAQVEQTVQVAAAEGKSGQEVYDTACFICHATGVTGAPKPGDVDNWKPRIEQGVDLLYSNAINGYQGQFGIMPPKGGNLLLTDDEVKAAVDYLVELIE